MISRLPIVQERDSDENDPLSSESLSLILRVT